MTTHNNLLFYRNNVEQKSAFQRQNIGRQSGLFRIQNNPDYSGTLSEAAVPKVCDKKIPE